jgi:hypothetical protein
MHRSTGVVAARRPQETYLWIWYVESNIVHNNNSVKAIDFMKRLRIHGCVVNDLGESKQHNSVDLHSREIQSSHTPMIHERPGTKRAARGKRCALIAFEELYCTPAWASPVTYRVDKMPIR